MNDKKVLIVATRLFWPTDSGKKVSLYHCCKALHDVFGYDIYMFSFLEDGQTPELLNSMPELVKDVQIAKKVNVATKLKNLVFNSVFRGKSFQNSLFYSRANSKALKNYFRRVKPDVVIFDMLRTARYSLKIKDFKGKSILYLDDLLSKRYFRQAECCNTRGNIAGKFANELPSIVKKFIKNQKLRKKILISESKRIGKEEIFYSKKFDHVILCSDRETEEFNKILGSQKVVTIRQCVDFDDLSQKKSECSDRELIGFLGNLNYAPNIASVDLIVKNVLPKIKHNYKMIVVGPVSEDIKLNYSENSKIEFLGRVDDLAETLQKCSVFLSPIAYGSGVKTKILEAMAIGLPVVTNSLGVEGIDGENGEHFLVTDDYYEMANCVDKLISDSQYAKALACSAQTLIRDKYQWSVTLVAYKKLGL